MSEKKTFHNIIDGAVQPSADGAMMAVAANGDDSGSGIDGNQSDNSVRDSGAVFIY